MVNNNVSREILTALKAIPTQTAVDAMYKMGWPMGFIEGARPLSLGQSMVGRAVTLRFVPVRPDLQIDKPKDDLSPEYIAIEKEIADFHAGKYNVKVMLKTLFH